MPKGYKVTIRGATHSHKTPFFCPHCKKPTGTIDNEWLHSLGICRECVVMHVEERSRPTIDLAQYIPPGGLFEGMTREEIDLYFLNHKNK